MSPLYVKYGGPKWTLPAETRDANNWDTNALAWDLRKAGARIRGNFRRNTSQVPGWVAMRRAVGP